MKNRIFIKIISIFLTIIVIFIVLPGLNQVKANNQDFSWGVLTINPNKSVYSPDEIAKFSIGVLDDKGKMVCDAQLKLEIRNPKSEITILSTNDGTIKVNQECQVYGLVDKPDFEANYQVKEIGIYNLELIAITKNGKQTIYDNFVVSGKIDFDIEKDIATRIYPVETYPAKITIIPHQNFKGQIIQEIPDSFQIPNSNQQKPLIWTVNWQKGQKYELNFEFKAPNISPKSYQLAPLQFIEEGKQVIFQESRPWQIASDATTFTSATTGNWQDCNTWNTCPGAVEGTDWPGPNDTAVISLTHEVTVTTNQTVSALQFGSLSTTGKVIVNSGIILTVTNAVTLLGNLGAGTAGTIQNGTGAGTINAASIGVGSTGTTTLNTATTLTNFTSTISNFTVSGAIGTNCQTNGTGSRKNTTTINLSSGSMSVGGTITLCSTGMGAQFNMNGGSQNATLITSAATPWATITSPATATLNGTSATVAYSGANQAILVATYMNLTLSGSGTATGAVTTVSGNFAMSGTVSYTTAAAFAVTGTATIGTNTTFTAATFALTVTGTTSVTGTLTISSATGTKAFNGDLTINLNGTFNNTVANASLTLPGSLTNNGTFNPGTGTYTLSGASKTINGTFANTFTAMTISGGSQQNNGTLTATTLTVDNTITNAGTITVTTTLAGASTLTNGASATLNIGAASVTPTLTATAANNTVNYNSTGQTIKNTTYVNLTISGTISTGTQTATIGGIFNVSGTFTPSAGTMTMNTGASIVNSNTLTFQGLTIAASATVTTTASFSIAATLTVNASANFSPSGGTITMTTTSWAITNSATLVFSGLTIAETPSVSGQPTSSFSIGGTLTTNSGKNLAPTAGTITMTGTVWSLTNTGSLTFYNWTIDGTPSPQPIASFSVANTLTVNSGKNLSPTAGTITMTGGSIVNSGGTLTFYNLIVSGSTSTTSTFGISNDLTANGTLTVSSGTGVITANGNITGSGTMTLTAGTFQQVVVVNKTFGSSSNANDWTFNNLKFNNSDGAAGHTITPNAGTGQIIVGGTLTLGDSGAQTITFNNETSNDRIFDLNGDLTISSQGVFSASSTQAFNIGGSYTNNGVFTANSGLVTFDAGSSGKNLSGTLNGSSAFNQLTFNNGSGAWTVNNALEATGVFNLTNGSLTQGANIDFLLKGNVTLANGTTFVKASGSGLFKLDGTPSQTFDDQHLVTKADLGNVIIGQSPGTTTLKSDLSANSLTIKTSDTFNTKGYEVTLTTYLDCQGSCILNLTDTAPNNETDGTIITVGTDWTMSATGTFTPYTNSKVYFNGTGNQTIATGGKAFWEVETNNTGTTNDNLIISNDLDVNGNLTLTDGELLLSTNNPNINTASNVGVGSSASLTKGSGTWTFDGSGTNTWSDNTSGQDFGIVVVDGSSKTITTSTNTKATTMTIGANDTLNIDSDTLTILGSGTPLTINTGGTFTTTSSTVIYAGTTATNITTTPYNNLTLTPVSGTPTFSLTGNLTGGTALSGNLTINTGATLDTVSGSNYGITLGGSWDNNATFTANSSTVTFNASSTGKTIEAGGSSFYDIVFNSGTGGWTIQTDNLTATRNFTVTDVSSLAIAASKTVEVDGTYSVANTEPTAITWNANSVLYLNSGTPYTVGSKNQTAATYATLQIGVNTDIRMWNSTATTFTVAASGSLYSQDHANANGDLYIWGDYHTQTAEYPDHDYWSYAIDFDGTNLSGGSERQVDVRIDPSSNVTVDSGDTLTAIGTTSPNRTTVSRQGGSGGYGITVTSGSTINFQYVNFDYLDASLGLDIQASSTVTSLDNTKFDNLVGATAPNNAFITIASSVIGSGTKTITSTQFDNTGSIASFNVNRTGTDDSGYWFFTSSTGTFTGEAYDGKNGVNEADPGMLHWDNSVVPGTPTAPTVLWTDGATNPTISNTTPKFSAVYNDPDASDIANKYRIQVNTDPTFVVAPFWDSGAAGTSMNNCVEGNRCQEITYGGSALSLGTTYYWRIKFWDDGGTEGDWSTGTNYFIVQTQSNSRFNNLRLRNLRIKPNN